MVSHRPLVRRVVVLVCLSPQRSLPPGQAHRKNRCSNHQFDYISMYVRTCAYMRAYAIICTRMHIYAYIYIYIYIYMHICAHMRIYASMHIYAHAYAYMHICAHMCIYVSIYAYMHAYANAHIWVYMRADVWSAFSCRKLANKVVHEHGCFDCVPVSAGQRPSVGEFVHACQFQLKTRATLSVDANAARPK